MSAPVTMQSLADAKLEDTQRRLSFLWSAAHSPLAQHSPLVAAHMLRVLRKVAAQEDYTLATSHTQTSFCSQCCQVRLPGVNTRVRVEASAEKRRREKQRKRKRQRRAAATAAQQVSAFAGKAAESASSSAANATDSESQQTDGSALETPKKRRRASSTPSVLGAALSFVSPFAGRPASSVSAAASAASSVSSHSLVMSCLSCGHRDRIVGQSARQKQQLRAASSDLSSLESLTTSARNEQEERQQQQQAAMDAAVAAKESTAKRQKLLHSLQAQSHPTAPAPALRASLPSLQQLSQAQQRLQAARAQLQSGDGSAVSSVLGHLAPAQDSFFSAQVRDAAQPIQPLHAAAPAAAPLTPAAPAAGRFSFSRSSATPPATAGARLSAPASTGVTGVASARKPSLQELLKGEPRPSTAASFSSSAIQLPFSSPAAASGKGAAGGGAVSMLGSIQIVGGMRAMPSAGPPAALAGPGSSKGFSFTKQSGKVATNMRKSR